MKKVFLLTAAVFTIAAFESCSKCGHCVTTVTYTVGGVSQSQKSEGDIYCGDNNNESGSYAKEAKLECERWPSLQPTQTGVTYSSEWVTDK